MTQARYPCAPAQAGIVYAALAGGAGIYVQQVVIELPEDVDAGRLEAAWQQTVARHDALRTSFDLGPSEVLQVVDERLKVPFVVEDVRGLGADRAEARWRELLAADREAGFDPGAAPLLRLTLWRLADGAWRLLWTYHHAILDGRSRLVVLREAFARYDGEHEQTAAPPPPFRHFAEWAAAHGSGDDARRFWTAALDGVTTGTAPPSGGHGHGHGRGGGGRGGSVGRRLDAALCERLRELGARPDLTLATILQGAFALLLAQATEETDVVFGAMRAGRRSAPMETGDMVGVLMVNSPVRVRVDPDAGAFAWLGAQRDHSLAVRDHEHTPLVDIQRWVGVVPGRSLVEVLFSFENEMMDQAQRARGGLWSQRAIEMHERLDYGLTFSVYGDERILVKAHHDGERVDAATATLLLDRYERLLGEIAAAGEDTLVGSLGLLADHERRRLSGEQDASVPVGPGDTVGALFAAGAREHPDAVAVQCGAERVTYAELDARAGAIAAGLRRAGAGPDTRVGIAMGRTPGMVAALLGIHRAGGAYVPLDPRYPRERLAFMLADGDVGVVLADAAGAEALGTGHGVTVLDPGAPVADGGAPRPVPETPTGRLSHVIYTSGSTGMPKGVLIEHGAVAELTRWAADTFSAAERDGMLASTSLSFDLSVFELLTTLALGGRVVLVEDLLALAAPGAAEALDVAFVNTVPSALAEVLRDGRLPPSVTTVALAGEALPRTLVDRLYALPGVQAVWNLYGPSEDTTYSTAARCERLDPGPPPIGRPLPGTQAYVLDARLRPVDVGVPGELFLGGRKLARGYHERPELTAERFVANPFAGAPSPRLYRTGDRVRWALDGGLEYLGRADDQVKIRGHRIEPGEVRQALVAHPAIADAAVVTRGDGIDRRLVAYVVKERGADVAGVRADLGRTLPAQLVPATLVTLAALPLTPNGKLDRAALPDPVARTYSGGPLTATERELAAIWQELLDLDALPGPGDEFFALGGHSLLALRLLTRIEERLGDRPPLSALFTATTLRGLAEVVEAERAGSDRSPLIPVRPWGSRPPWFCVMTDHRGVIGMRNVLPAVLSDQPVFALQAIDPRNPSWRTSSVAAIAATCLAAMREQCPSGPYRLGGYSLGGLVAWEMACRLEEAGEEVELLALLDTLAPEMFSLRGRIGARRRVTRDVSAAWKLRSWRQFGEGEHVRWKAMRSGPHAQRAWTRARGFDDPYDHAGAVHLSSGFRARRFGGRLVVYATASTRAAAGSDLLGWELHAAGPAESVPVPGEHVAILTTEHVEGFSRALAATFETLEAPTAPAAP